MQPRASRAACLHAFPQLPPSASLRAGYVAEPHRYPPVLVEWRCEERHNGRCSTAVPRRPGDALSFRSSLPTGRSDKTSMDKGSSRSYVNGSSMRPAKVIKSRLALSPPSPLFRRPNSTHQPILREGLICSASHPRFPPWEVGTRRQWPPAQRPMLPERDSGLSASSAFRGEYDRSRDDFGWH
ncbi:hypothetical protein BV25DRAFT_1817950, partial [Artomyces pyxidatus]